MANKDGGPEVEVAFPVQEDQDKSKEIAQTPEVQGITAQNANAVGFQCSSRDNAMSPIAVK